MPLPVTSVGAASLELVVVFVVVDVTVVLLYSMYALLNGILEDISMRCQKL